MILKLHFNFSIVENGSSTACNYITISKITEQRRPHIESKYPDTANVKEQTLTQL